MPLDTGVSFASKVTSAVDLGSVTWAPPAQVLTTLADGTSNSQVDIIYADTRTIAASGSYSIDLSGTQDQDVFGRNLAFVKVRGIWIYALPANTNSVIVGNGTNPFVGPWSAGTVTHTIPPGGEFFATAPVGGWTVTAATADVLKLANSSSGTGVDLRIIVWGASA